MLSPPSSTIVIGTTAGFQLAFIFYMSFKKPVLWLIRGYQKTLSFDHGPMKRFFPYGFCRFHPTCSQYTYTAIQKYGLVKGGIKGIWRVLRCNPWSKGGEDPVK